MITYYYKFIEKLNVDGLDDIKIDLKLPSVKTKKYETIIKDGRVEIISNDFKPYYLYDFVVDVDGNLYIGTSHYKLSNKAEIIKAAGELKINDSGKIIYLNNQSGHYKPTKQHLDSILKIFKEYDLTQNDLEVQYKFI